MFLFAARFILRQPKSHNGSVVDLKRERRQVFGAMISAIVWVDKPFLMIG